MTLLVLAAGMGNRYGGLKQFDPVGPNGEAIIDYSIYNAILEGFTKIVFVIQSTSHSKLQNHIQDKFGTKIRVVYVYQELSELPGDKQINPKRTKPLGTGHAVWSAKNEINEPFVVINADDFYGRDAFRLITEHFKNSKKHCLIGYSIRNTLSKYGSVSRAICNFNQQNELQSLTEHTQIYEQNGSVFFTENNRAFSLTGNEVVSMNMIGLMPAAFDTIDEGFTSFLDTLGSSLTMEYYLPSVLCDLMEKKNAPIQVLLTVSNWFGVTYQEDKYAAIKKINALIESGAYPKNIWNN